MKVDFNHLPMRNQNTFLFHLNTKIPIIQLNDRLTLVASVVADGTILNNMIIVSRKTIELELYYYGYRPEKGYYYVSQENTSMTKEV